MVTEEEIRRRKQEYAHKYAAQKNLQKLKSEKIKNFNLMCREGNRFLKDIKQENRIFTYIGIPGTRYSVYAIAVQKNLDKPRDKKNPMPYTYVVGYSFAKEPDYDDLVASGLCGYRIKHKNKYSFEITVTKPCYLEDAITAVLTARVYSVCSEVPQGLVTDLFGKIKDILFHEEEDVGDQTTHCCACNT